VEFKKEGMWEHFLREAHGHLADCKLVSLYSNARAVQRNAPAALICSSAKWTMTNRNRQHLPSTPYASCIRPSLQLARAGLFPNFREWEFYIPVSWEWLCLSGNGFLIPGWGPPRGRLHPTSGCFRSLSCSYLFPPVLCIGRWWLQWRVETE